MTFQKFNKRKHVVSRFLIGMLCLLFLVSYASCGRRGDPVPIMPQEENNVKRDTEEVREQPSTEKEDVSPEDADIMPDPPVGLIGLYTQKAVVLTWDEGGGDDVKLYKVYRSTGEEYVFVGDTAAPAFTDRDVSPDTKYYYKVTAVGVLESSPSKEIEIVTEVH